MAITKNYNDFDLSLLIYGITLTRTERKALSKKMSFIKNLQSVKIVKYVEDKDLFIVNEGLQASSRYNSGDNELEKNTTEIDSQFVYNIFSNVNVVLNDIKDTSSFGVVTSLIDILTRFQSFTSSFKTDVIYKKFLQKDNLEFTDEVQLQDYILYVLETIKIDAANPVVCNNVGTLADIKKQYIQAGWQCNGESLHSRNAISLVMEKNNWRFYFLKKHTSYYRLNAGLVHSSNPIYSYIDAGRQFYDTDKYNLSKPLNDIGAVLSSTEEECLSDYFKNKFKIEPITKTLLDALTNAEKKKEVYSKRQATLSVALQKKVEYKLKLIKNGTESFKLNDIEYNTNSIEYSGQKIQILSHDSGPFLETVGAKVLESLYEEAKEQGEKGNYNNNYHYNRHAGKRFKVAELNHKQLVYSINDISFDVIYDEFIAFVDLYSLQAIKNKKSKGIKLQIGDVVVDITTQTLININGVESLRIYLNGNKIVKDDVFYCVHQAISYETQNKYDEFLQSVSYTSLKIHKLTKSGVYLNFHDYIMNKKIKLTIPVKRIKNKNYLVINNTKKAIRKTDAILRLHNKGSILEIIKVLVDDTIVTNLKYSDLKGFIVKGQEEYEKVEAQKTALINSTMDALDITKEEHIILDNGNTLKDVYRISGTLRSYYVESKEPFKIYSEKEGRYICMLDKTPYVSPEVKLVSRFYALKNDSVISKEVATLDF